MPISPPSFHSSPPVSLIPWPLVCTEYREKEKAEAKGVSDCEDDDGEKEEQGGGGDPTDGIRQQLPLLPSTWDKKGASPLSLCPRGKQDDGGGIKILHSGRMSQTWMAWRSEDIPDGLPDTSTRVTPTKTIRQD